MPLKAVLNHVLPELQREGFCVPGPRAFEGRLANDLPLGQRPCPSGGHPQKLCTLMHLLNLLWQPILEHIDALSCGKASPWTPGLAKTVPLGTRDARDHPSTRRHNAHGCLVPVCPSRTHPFGRCPSASRSNSCHIVVTSPLVPRPNTVQCPEHSEGSCVLLKDRGQDLGAACQQARLV